MNSIQRIANFRVEKSAPNVDSRILESSPQPGEIKAWPISNIPDGWLLCDGSEISRTTYLPLFIAIGTTYGIGDGTTTFNLPNLSGKVVNGSGNGVGLTSRTLGETGGEEEHILLQEEMPAHNHNILLGDGIASSVGTGKYLAADASGEVIYSVTVGGNQLNQGVISQTGAGSPANVMQPFLVVRYIIRT